MTPGTEIDPAGYDVVASAQLQNPARYHRAVILNNNHNAFLVGMQANDDGEAGPVLIMRVYTYTSVEGTDALAYRDALQVMATLAIMVG